MVYPYLYWKYAHYSNLSYLEVPFSIPVCCNVACFLLMSLQLNWSYIILKGCAKYLHKTPDKEDQDYTSNDETVDKCHNTGNGVANHLVKNLHEAEHSHFKHD